MIKAFLNHRAGKARLSYPDFDEEFTWTPYGPPRALLHELAVLHNSSEETYLWVEGDFDWERRTSEVFSSYPVPLGLDRNVRVLRLRGQAQLEACLIADVRPLRVTILAHSTVPGRGTIDGHEAAVQALASELRALECQGRAFVQVVSLNAQPFDDWVASLRGATIDLLVYVGHCESNASGSPRIVVGRSSSDYLRPLSDVLGEIEAALAGSLPGVFLAACDSARAYEYVSTPAIAGLEGPIAGDHYVALCGELGRAVAGGERFSRACQRAWLAASSTGHSTGVGGWGGALRIALCAQDDRLVHSGEEIALECYRKCVEQKFNQLPGPGGVVPADDVYEELPLLLQDEDDSTERRANDRRRAAPNPHEGWTRFIQGGQHRRVWLRDVIRTRGGLVIKADPGAGKTTLLRQTTRCLLQQRGEVALYIHLGRAVAARDLIDAACLEADLHGSSDWSPALDGFLRNAIERAREEGRLTLLLDGVDEVAIGPLGTLSGWLGTYLDRSRTRFVIGTRPSGDVAILQNQLPPCQTAYLAVLHTRQIRKAAQAWRVAFKGSAGVDDLLPLWRAGSATWQLAHNPFMLRGMCSLAPDSRHGSISTLQELVVALVQHMMAQASARVAPVGIVSGASVRGALYALLELVVEEMAEEASSIVDISLTSASERYLEVARASGQPLAVLFDWLRSSGILVCFGNDRWGFVHRVFEEYFVGRWIAQTHGKTFADLEHWIRRHAIDPERQWCRRELFEALRWMGPFLTPEVMHDLTTWLIRHDTVLFDGTILAARTVALATDRAFRFCTPLVDRRIADLLRFFGHVLENVLRPWPGGLKSYVTRRSALGLGGAPWQFLGDQLLGEQGGRAAEIVAALGARECIPNAEELIELRRGIAPVVHALGEMGATESIPWIGSLIEYGNIDVRVEVVTALGRLGAVEYVDAIVAALNSHSHRLSEAAAHALVDLDARSAVPELVALLQYGRKPHARASALWALASLADPDAAALIASLVRDDDLKNARFSPVDALVMLRALEWIPTIVAAVSSHNFNVCADALRALAALHVTEHVSTIRGFLGRGRSERSAIRSEAIRALAELRAKEAIPDIVACMHREEPDHEVIRALGCLKAREHASLIRSFLHHGDPHVRVAAVEAIGELGATECIEELAIILQAQQTTGFLFVATVNSIRQLGAPDTAAYIKVRALSRGVLHYTSEEIDALRPWGWILRVPLEANEGGS